MVFLFLIGLVTKDRSRKLQKRKSRIHVGSFMWQFKYVYSKLYLGLWCFFTLVTTLAIKFWILLFLLNVFSGFLRLDLIGELKLNIKWLFLLPVRDFLWGLQSPLTTTECVDLEGLPSLLLIGLLVKNLLEAQACFISSRLILVASSDILRHFRKQS